MGSLSRPSLASLDNLNSEQTILDRSQFTIEALKRTFHLLSTQYPFSILYLSPQIQMDIVYHKREFSRFLICFEK